jgi:hypothetical protein
METPLSYLTVFIIGVFVTAIGCFFIDTYSVFPKYEKEICSYQCLVKTKKWPSSVQFLGRNDKGQARCECFVKVENK